MFESVSSEAVHRDSRARYFGALPVSLLVHGIAMLGLLIAATQTVTFPTEAPAMAAMYSLAEVPLPPPPPPPPPPKPQQAVELVKQEVLRRPPTEDFAPSVIPDEIPIVAAPFVAGGVEGGVDGGVEGGTTDGMVGGTPDSEGVPGGEVGGTMDAVVSAVDEGRVIIPRDKALRMTALSQTVPTYPERARLQRWEDQLVVRYVIGKDGRVKEVTILDPADRKIFDEATINAIRHWRFRPMIKDGEAKEVVHELTIRYRLTV